MNDLSNYYYKLSSAYNYNFYLLFFKNSHTKPSYFTVFLILPKMFFNRF